ncbi:MAG: phosphatidate cytidylyltransferase [Paludibacteraceae bacterium]
MSFLLRASSFVILVSLFLFSLLSKSLAAQILFTAFAAISAFFVVYETFSMLEKINKQGFKILTSMISAVVILFMMCFELPQRTFQTGMVFLIIGLWIFMLFVFENRQQAVDKVVNSFGVFLMVAVPLSFLVLIYRDEPMLLLFMTVVTKVGDTGAYIVGTLSGKLLKGKNHKIVPRISPSKSWEGMFGGLLFSVTLSIILAGTIFGGKTIIHYPVLLGIVLFFGGFAGDLVESVLKRTCGVKDSGNTIPGMGGFFDFLDSLLLNAPLFFLYMLYFNV